MIMERQPTKISFTCGMKYLARSFGFLGKRRNRFWAGTLLACLELLVAYITPALSQQLVTVLETGSYEELRTGVLALFSALLLCTPLVALGDYWKKQGALEMEKNMSLALFDKVQALPLRTMERYETGDYVTRITGDAKAATGAVKGYTFKALTKFVLYTVISMVILLRAGLLYAAVGFLMSLVAFGVSFFFSPRARVIEHRAKNLAAGLALPLMETVKNAPVIRVFRLDRKLQEQFAKKCRQIADERVLFRAANGMIESVIYLFSACVKPVTFLMGIFLLVRGETDIASVVYLSGITGVLAEGIQSFSQFIQFVQSGFVSLARVYEILDLTGEEPEEKDGVERAAGEQERNGSAIHLEGVRFGYREAEVLKGIDLDIKKGQKVAVTGSSGCGKSTLLKLIAGLYEPCGGELWICGAAGPAEGKGASPIAYVSQASDVFRASVRENIGYGRRNADLEEIKLAAQKAGCREFIERLPQTYDTLIDEHGTNISGGQRQRIALARALLKNAPILVLDEATSALDASSEDRILSDIMEAAKEDTVLMVTHRILAAGRMERIIVMKDGRIVQDGTHEELMAVEGEYKRMYEVQSAV